jgi:hypothetical protein
MISPSPDGIINLNELKLDRLPNKHQFGYNCTICNKDEGYTIKCDYGNCKVWFHIRCAISNELIKVRYLMDEQVSKELPWMIYVFCKEHMESGKQLLNE